jgi:hypothetical protein
MAGTGRQWFWANQDTILLFAGGTDEDHANVRSGQLMSRAMLLQQPAHHPCTLSTTMLAVVITGSSRSLASVDMRVSNSEGNTNLDREATTLDMIHGLSQHDYMSCCYSDQYRKTSGDKAWPV